jgi:putative ABC transport system permease protein
MGRQRFWKILETKLVVKWLLRQQDLLQGTLDMLILGIHIPVSNIRRMDEYIADSIAAPRFNTILVGSFAALALVLAAVGIFGIVSYSVAQRTQEMGIRRALGAGDGNVMFLVLAQGVRLAAAGMALGLAAAYFVTRLMTTLLFEVAPADPATIACVAAILMAVAFLASYFPARRATRVDPMAALRYE